MAAHGLWALTLERLAQDCECRKSLISFHFGSKTGLLSAILSEDGATAAGLVRETWARRRGQGDVSDLVGITRKTLTDTVVAEAIRWACTAAEEERELLAVVMEPLLSALSECLSSALSTRGLGPRARRSVSTTLLLLAVFSENLPSLRLRALGTWLDGASRR